MKNLIIFLIISLISFAACNSSNSTGSNPIQGLYDYNAPFAAAAPVIDGKGDDPAWKLAEWRPIDQVWLGGGNASTSNLNPPSPADYEGRFKIVWTSDRLYYLVEIKDTYLSLDRISNPYDEIYKDDCLELFINEDGKGGNHENNNKAFAYHMSYDGINAMDYVAGQSGAPFQNGYIARNHHVNYKIGNLDLADKKSIDGSNKYTWEVEMKIFDKNYPIKGDINYQPVKLSAGKTMGFAAAYCNAGKKPGAEKGNREYFMGSMFIEGSNKNVAYQNAGVFAKLRLVNNEAVKQTNKSTEESTLEIQKPVIDSSNSFVSLVKSFNTANVTQHTYASIKVMVDEAIRLAGGLEGIVKTGDTVVLKPNIITTVYGWSWPGGAKIPAGAPNSETPAAPNGIVTDWRVVQAVAENVRAIIGSTGKILVMESSGKGSTEVQYKNVGYNLTNLSAVDEILTLDAVGGSYWTNPNPAVLPGDILKIKLNNPVFTNAFSQTPDYSGKPPNIKFTSYDGQGNYYVAKQMYEADALISIPVLKLHTTAGTTGAIKNISIGASPPRIYGNAANDIGRNFRIPHSEANGIHKWIADYYSVMPADFVVMDALQGADRGPLPPAGDASALKKLNSILASRDGLAIDVVLSNIIKVDYTKVGHLKYLTDRGEVGTKTNKKLTVHGNPKDIIVIGNKKIHDLRESVNFAGSISTGLGGSISSTRLSEQQLEKSAVTIKSAQFNRQNLNLNLTVSENTVKADIYIGKTFLKSVKENYENVVVDASAIANGSHNIKVYAYTNYMVYAEAASTAVK